MTENMKVTTKRIEVYHLWHTVRFPQDYWGWDYEVADSILTYTHTDRGYVYYTDKGNAQIWEAFQEQLTKTEGEENE